MIKIIKIIKLLIEKPTGLSYNIYICVFSDKTVKEEKRNE